MAKRKSYVRETKKQLAQREQQARSALIPHEIAVLNWRNNPTLAQGIRYFYG